MSVSPTAVRAHLEDPDLAVGESSVMLRTLPLRRD